jgi:hypothetical protein
MLSVTNRRTSRWGDSTVDTPKKPQTSDEEDVPATPAPAPSPSLQARSPFRPRSLRRRQAHVAEPPPAVERPSTSLLFDASPTTAAAALAMAGGSPEKPSLAWKSEPSGVERDDGPEPGSR